MSITAAFNNNAHMEGGDAQLPLLDSKLEECVASPQPQPANISGDGTADKLIEPLLQTHFPDDANSNGVEQDKKSPEETELQKYKYNPTFVGFVEKFSRYCEDKSRLFFNGDIFFDNDYFPQHVRFKDYLPVNILSPKVLTLQVEIPYGAESCMLASWTPAYLDFRQAPQAPTLDIRRECILRDHVAFVFNSLECTNIVSFIFSNVWSEGSTSQEFAGCLEDRLSDVHAPIISFISKHKKTLRVIEFNSMKSTNKTPIDPAMGDSEVSIPSQATLPQLDELTVAFWDSQSVKVTYEPGEERSESCEWFPDHIDAYWINVMKSQVHGHLKILCWISDANLDWNTVFQPILDCNQFTLEIFHVLYTCRNPSLNLNWAIKTGGNGDGLSCKSPTVLSCESFQNLKKLKNLYLRRDNSYLTDLHKLPQSLAQLCFDDIYIKSDDIKRLGSLRSLKLLKLVDNSPETHFTNPTLSNPAVSFGVNQSALNALLHCRCLQELSVWGHTVELCHLKPRRPGSMLCDLVSNIGRLLTLGLIVPDADEQQGMEQLQQREFTEKLGKVGFINEDCFVVQQHKKK